METLSLDTHPDFEKLQIQQLWQMPHWRKMDRRWTIAASMARNLDARETNSATSNE